MDGHQWYRLALERAGGLRDLDDMRQVTLVVEATTCGADDDSGASVDHGIEQGHLSLGSSEAAPGAAKVRTSPQVGGRRSATAAADGAAQQLMAGGSAAGAALQGTGASDFVAAGDSRLHFQLRVVHLHESALLLGACALPELDDDNNDKCTD